MGWGGARQGSGPKPKAKPLAVFKGGKVDPPVDVDASPLREPPAGLNEIEADFWRTHAPLAIERRTLIEATVPGFRLLCELHAKKVVVGTAVDAGDMGGLRIYAQLAKQVEGLMARFCLAPFGKPPDGTTTKKSGASNPWNSFKTGTK